ncbi:MAG: TetR family transcriptional regulator [Acetobacteraceae bacterium]|nr:TetR family transcriptional regulator [Acetobacteraceae bacterium]
MSRRPATPEETRIALLDTAEQLFRQVGYAKTTVSDIAEALGMSSANVYRFFPSKSAINNAICDRMLGQLEAAMRNAAAQPGTAAARLEAVIMASHEGHRTMLTDEKRVFDMVYAAMEEHWEAIMVHLADCDAIVAGVIRDGIASGEFAPGDPDALARTVMCACSSLFHPVLVAQCANDPEQPLMARRLVWLAIAALANHSRSPMP